MRRYLGIILIAVIVIVVLGVGRVTGSPGSSARRGGLAGTRGPDTRTPARAHVAPAVQPVDGGLQQLALVGGAGFSQQRGQRGRVAVGQRGQHAVRHGLVLRRGAGASQLAQLANHQAGRDERQHHLGGVDRGQHSLKKVRGERSRRSPG